MRKIEDDRRGYVYRHVRLDTNEVFYVGVGFDETFSRARKKSGRTQYWKNITNKTEYRIDIMMDDLSKDMTFNKEKEFIKLYGRKDLGLGTLVNMTNGGESGLGGTSHNKGKKLSSETCRKMSESRMGIVTICKEFEILNPEGKVIKGENIAKFCRENNLERGNIWSVIAGKIPSYKCWKSINPEFHVKVKTTKFLSPKKELYEITNITKFCKENNINCRWIHQMIQGNIPHAKGWHLENPKPEFIPLIEQALLKINKRYFINLGNEKIVQFKDRVEFAKRYNITVRQLYKFLNGNNVKKLIKLGWTIPTEEEINSHLIVDLEF